MDQTPTEAATSSRFGRVSLPIEETERRQRSIGFLSIDLGDREKTKLDGTPVREKTEVNSDIDLKISGDQLVAIDFRFSISISE